MIAALANRIRNKKLSWTSRTLIFFNVGAVGLFSWAVAGFGSIGSAWAYLNGDRLLVDAYSKSFGSVETGRSPTVVFQITNYCDRPVTIVGANAPCGCAVTSELPMVVASQGHSSVKVSVQTRGMPSAVREQIQLLTDVPGQPRIYLQIGGRVSNSSGGTTSTGSNSG
jgi:hypothetical protein